ncbi:hypothetical protein BCV72DRAFT_301371 [Rhizopus microsporus var. microsporus]|uniref:Nudix hydrolase domain-containing protein n=2 Tax=Rhizopus microsporus TaxID=58291 RepID=A0A2G4SGP6_RHIZD|nr:uncharacterized protein RHIMIDRAFT_242093 [Rhizopus microsporus ATCC 52813]ORE11058.1 hypothetical protein BCV72DRAFT_301371 [Rhizopus microsporus var. microsporus]PHZ07935.1 hypothetical protein RHIMIDRAFT_242093 [Rhizopus microsporus ATCC 52813]
MQPLVPIETSKSSETLGQGDWLALERIEFIDKQGTKRSWERCIRRKTHSSKVDAVDIHAIILTPEPELLLVIQYRPAIKRYCLEFPSGLIDANDDDPLISAQRELKEETGYVVPKEQMRLTKLPLAYEPGLTDSCCYVAKTVIDPTMVDCAAPEPEIDEWSLQTISLPLQGLLERLEDLEKQHDGLLVIDSRVYSLASGLVYAKEFK